MSRGRQPVTSEPTSVVDQIAAAGMKAMEAKATELGNSLGDSLIFVTLDSKPDDGINASTHPRMTSEGHPDGVSVLAYAASHVQSMAKALGIPLRMSIAGSELGRARRRPTPQRGRPPR